MDAPNRDDTQDSELIERANDLGIDVKRVVAEVGMAGLRQVAFERWAEVNTNAFRSWREWDETHGSPLDSRRAF